MDSKSEIIKTIIFFDLFNYPLTSWEVWKFGSWQSEVGLVEVMGSLEELKAAGRIECKDGFFFLPGRAGLIDVRKERYNFTDKKMRRAIRVAKLFKIIPWIKLIAVGNLIGAHNLREGGDIDLFIVTARGRVWLTRFFTVLVVKLLGLRPTPQNSRDAVCLSFYASEDALSLEGFRLSDDVYFRHWLAGLYPICDTGRVYEKLIDANAWLETELPNWRPVKTVHRRDARKSWPNLYRLTVDFLFGGLERPLQKLQLQLMPIELKQMMNRDTRVVADEWVVKLHGNDRREEYKSNYELRITNYGQAE